MNQYIDAIAYALKNASIRMKYYEETNESRFLTETNDWVEVANIYLKFYKS